jgi:hypothetical protein
LEHIGGEILKVLEKKHARADTTAKSLNARKTTITKANK